MPKPNSDRVRTHRIRTKAANGEPLTDDEAAFLDDYESSMPKTTGKSASSRVVHLDIEEQAAAEGNHPHPDAYAAMARSEGLRADTLLRIVTEKLMQCNDQYLRLMMHMMERSTRLEDAHVSLLEAVRDSHLARIDAEGQAKVAEQIAAMGGDSELQQIMQMLAPILAAKMNPSSSKSESENRKKVKRKSRKPLGAL